MNVEKLRRALADIHRPVPTEAEFYCDDDSPTRTDCPGDPHCAGHIETVLVCRECGHDHDDGYPVYRPWPCPTARAADLPPGHIYATGEQQ